MIMFWSFIAVAVYAIVKLSLLIKYEDRTHILTGYDLNNRGFTGVQALSKCLRLDFWTYEDFIRIFSVK